MRGYEHSPENVSKETVRVEEWVDLVEKTLTLDTGQHLDHPFQMILSGNLNVERTKVRALDSSFDHNSNTVSSKASSLWTTETSPTPNARCPCSGALMVIRVRVWIHRFRSRRDNLAFGSDQLSGWGRWGDQNLNVPEAGHSFVSHRHLSERDGHTKPDLGGPHSGNLGHRTKSWSWLQGRQLWKIS